MSHANVDLAVRKGKVELFAACDHHAHSSRVLSVVWIWAFLHAIPGGVEPVVGSGALRNAHFGGVVGVVMQPCDCLAVSRQHAHLGIVVSEVTWRAAQRTIVALAGDRISEEVSPAVQHADSIRVQSKGIGRTGGLANWSYCAVDSESAKTAHGGAVASLVVSVLKNGEVALEDAEIGGWISVVSSGAAHDALVGNGIAEGQSSVCFVTSAAESSHVVAEEVSPA